MAKGALAKENIINKILETFEGAFKYDKEIRIPMMENGEEVQIKVALTCAKTNVDRGEDVAIPGASTVKASTTTTSATVSKVSTTVAEPTEEEKKNVEDLLIKLGLK
jgi:hypothetical protein